MHKSILLLSFMKKIQKERRKKYWSNVLKYKDIIQHILTSSGSISLNSIPRPVQAMKWEFDGSSRRATKNCHSWREPRRWYVGPSRYIPGSCLMSPMQKKMWVTLFQFIGPKDGVNLISTKKKKEMLL